jgi:hypothetical protein
VLDERPEARFAAALVALGQAFGGQQTALLARLLHRRAQSGQPVFHQVIRGAGAHGRHRVVLADGARNQDEGHVQAARL